MLIDADRLDARDPDAPPVAVVSRALGVATNNFAEYSAVNLALRRALELGAEEVELVLDSQLVVEQLAGRWKVRHPAIRPLVDEAHALLASFRRWHVRHEPRAANRAADALANLALDDPAAAARAEDPGAANLPGAGTDPIGQATIGAACAIFDEGGRVLLVRHTYGRRNWELPGGVAQPDEAPAAAAERELREETGLALAAARLTGVYYEAGHDFGPMLHFVFRFEPPAGRAPAPQPPEIDRLDWFPLDALPTPMSDFTERRIRDAAADSAAYAVVDAPRSWRT